jgi:NAD+ diphosphatase
MKPVAAPLDRSARTGFSTNSLDRMSEKRDDEALIEQFKHDPAARCVIIAGDLPILCRSAENLSALHAMANAAQFGTIHEVAFLGIDAAGPVFAVQLDGQVADTQQGRDDISVIDLRTIAVQGLVEAEAVGILGQAKSLMYWHQRHRFCSNCGAPTRVAAAGWRRECDHCKGLHFPRTDPVAIMLAVDGNRCLLGRQARFPQNMYSALAGFIEPGETVEDAGRREIREEAGIGVGRVAYLATQPWPFPASLMIGCLAQSLSSELDVDRTELEDARWFTIDECRMILSNTHPQQILCPPTMAIAHHLIRAWAIEGVNP